ncbi:hypothetical protein JCM19237_2377 [Photobacterium aphoticum]|uniref:Uncharacterized protein n=1 Tax=Photobacterium aphoticum TaxID=754436 RepID=A0A090QMR7_9GAMM|nr:hypothetical protein JCM19237_2377 [Photobacterium aphoticum]
MFASTPKRQKLWIARKTYIAIGVLIVVNLIILQITFSQRTHWIGHVESSQHNQTVSVEQYKDNELVDVIFYRPDNNKVVYDPFSYSYKFKQQNAQCYAVENREMNIPTSIKRYFALDDQCTLFFRTPVRQLLANVSLICRN